MSTLENSEPLAFFRALHACFGRMLKAGHNSTELVAMLATSAFDLFERNVAIETEDLPHVLACHKGCPACCCLRVTATAPEIFLLAQYIRRIHETPAGARLDLPGRIADADRTVRGIAPEQRMTVQCFCPLMLKDSCIIHPVRPLACRGHAAFDKQACIDAAAGRQVEVPVSEPHAVMRSLVQNALQSALRAHGYAWRAYELNHALHLVLSDEGTVTEWSRGNDVLAPALIADTDWAVLAKMFDEAVPASPSS